MDTNIKSPETTKEVFELFANSYKENNFTTNWYLDFSKLLNDNLISILNLLKQKGLVKHLGIGNSWWELTHYGRSKACNAYLSIISWIPKSLFNAGPLIKTLIHI